MNKFLIELLNEVSSECDKRLADECLPDKKQLFSYASKCLSEVIEELVEETVD